jgi:hypothetical protein
MSTATAAILTDSPMLAASLAEALQEYGFAPVAGARGHLVLVDANLPAAGATLFSSVRRSTPDAYLVAVLGWWDEREQDVGRDADFVLNAPLRAWQIKEMVEGFEAHVHQAAVA